MDPATANLIGGGINAIGGVLNSIISGNLQRDLAGMFYEDKERDRDLTRDYWRHEEDGWRIQADLARFTAMAQTKQGVLVLLGVGVVTVGTVAVFAVRGTE